MYNIEEINNYLKNNLSEYRYEHSLLVANSAKLLAKNYNLDENKAYLTGLVHDIAKEFNDEENNYYIEKYKLDNEYLEDELKPVLHSFIGAFFVKEKYGMDDEICNAIKYHTLGNSNMTLFDKIILVSDKIGRKEPDNKLIELAYQNIDDALLYIFEHQEKKLKEKNRKLHKDSINLVKKIKNML